MTKRRTTRSSSSEHAAPLPPAHPEDHQPLDDAVGFQIAIEVNLPQLQAELAAAADLSSINAALSTTSDGRTLLWIIPAGIDPDVVAQVVAAHKPDPDWGIPAAIKTFNDVLARLRENPDTTFSDADKDALLRGLALNYLAFVPLPAPPVG